MLEAKAPVGADNNGDARGWMPNDDEWAYGYAIGSATDGWYYDLGAHTLEKGSREDPIEGFFGYLVELGIWGFMLVYILDQTHDEWSWLNVDFRIVLRLNWEEILA